MYNLKCKNRKNQLNFKNLQKKIQKYFEKFNKK